MLMRIYPEEGYFGVIYLLVMQVTTTESPFLILSSLIVYIYIYNKVCPRKRLPSIVQFPNFNSSSIDTTQAYFIWNLEPRMSEPTGPTIRHETLSTFFTGLERNFFNTGGSNVWQFKGIKYGTIPARFYQASMNEKFPTISNATSYG
jgi:hypothetical protein